MGHAKDILDVRFFAPPERLAPYFTTFYRIIVNPPGEDGVKDLLQPEWGGMRFFSPNGPIARSGAGYEVNGAQFQAGGPSCLPTRFTLHRTRAWGFGLLPLGWATFVGTPASERANWIGDGAKTPEFAAYASLQDELYAEEPDDEREADVIVAFFERRLKSHPDGPRILALHRALLDPEVSQVFELANVVGTTRRTLERVCLRHFGFSPNLLLRRQRLMRTLAAFMLDKATTWTSVIDQNYHDQSHFVHEFHQFMTMSPTEYAALDHPILHAFMTERMRVWGSPAQTLDTPGGLDESGAAI